MERIRLIQVGLGFWGTSWATEVLPTVPSVEVVARVDPDPAARARIRERLGAAAGALFASLAEARRAVEADAVLASLPTNHHVPVCREALEAGLHVLTEKPFAPSLSEAIGLVRLATERGLVLGVSQNYRYYPAARRAAALVGQGVLGAPISVAIDFRRDAVAEGHRYPDIPDPLLADMAIHHVDLLRFVLGREPVEVIARSWNPPGSPFRDDASAAVLLVLEGGLVASWRGSWLSRGPATPWAGDWVIEAEAGQIEWTCRGNAGARLSADRLAIRRPGEPAEPVPLEPVPFPDRAGTIAAFAEAILAGEPPAGFPTGADNLASLATVAAAVRSAARGGARVRIAELLEAAADRPR
ncbi:MAG: Gfo/Idh/MocA family oxidoreductase [Geminicoccaceae bacterium]|nr:Gfo/Idh/MocA family oxidoreductase [Geminicoccaceae bacterium]